MSVEPVQQSILTWIFAALGLPYVILLSLAGLISFLLALLIVQRGKGSMAPAALILIVHAPLLIGIFAAIQGGIASYTIIATSGATPKPSEVAAGISTALIAPMIGMLLMVPGYATAAIGAFVRAVGAEAK
jgi:uncharacterized membrane protein